MKQYINKAINEIINPKFALTKQYLAVNEVVFEDGKPKVEDVDLDFSEDLVAVYFQIKNQEYFLQINVTKASKSKVNFVQIENGYTAYLTATSETLTFDELSKMLNINNVTGWSKGDSRKNFKSKYEFSRLVFNFSTNKGYSFEKLLNALLTELEKHSENIIQLTEKTETYISICKYQYISGNAGFHFDKETIKRLSKLNLSLDIDTYIVGNPIRDNDE